MGVTSQGMTIGDAFDQYTILTIGDGLVSSIPSLMISLATGILVTKGSRGQRLCHSTLLRQLFGIPKVLYCVGGVLIFLGIVTPLPAVIFITIGAISIIVGFNMNRKQEIKEIESEVDTTEEEAEEIRKPENVNSLLAG